jgi:predicted glycosyltransferase
VSPGGSGAVPGAASGAVPGAASGTAAEPRILLYSHDGFGLGHVQRNFNIACALVRAVRGATALLVGGSPHGFDCRLPPGVDWLKLPSVVKQPDGGWAARTLRLGQDGLRRLRAATIAAAVEHYRPRLIVVDHLPTGVLGELLPVLESCRRQPDPPRVVLGLRDVLDRPEAIRHQWLRDGAYRAIETLYDRVLIYGDEDIFPTAEVYGLSGRAPGRLVYCGYVGPAGTRRAERRVRAELNLLPREKLVLASGGGGADAHPLLAACAGAMARLARRMPLRCVLLTGPLMPERQRHELRRRAAGLPIEVWWQVEDLPGLLAAADLTVSMAGYNTLVEGLQARQRPVVVPRPGPSAEQTLRAAAFARRGLIHLLPPGRLSGARLAAAIEQGLDAARPPRTAGPRLDGLRRVVDELAALLTERAAAPRGPSARGRGRVVLQGAKPRSA